MVLSYFFAPNSWFAISPVNHLFTLGNCELPVFEYFRISSWLLTVHDLITVSFLLLAKHICVALVGKHYRGRQKQTRLILSELWEASIFAEIPVLDSNLMSHVS